MIHQYIRICSLLLLICTEATFSNGQNQIISLEEALDIAINNYAGLDRDRLIFDQYNLLADSGLPMQHSQISISGEELGANGENGIHTLNFQQNFYLPKASRVQQDYYRKGAGVAKQQLALTENGLKRQLTKAYYQLLYAKKEWAVVTENVSLFERFLDVTITQLEAGETGKIPQLAARTRLGQAQLSEEHAEEKYQIAHSIFNQWLRTEGQFDVSGDLIAREESQIEDLSYNNPHLQIIQGQKEVAASMIELEKSKLLPQITTGAKLQTNGNFPLYGYQLGLNIPLFKKNHKKHIESAKIGVLIQDAALRAEEQKLTQITSDLAFKLDHQRHILKYLDEELRPIVQEQKEVNYLAFREGEINYLEYLNSLEQVVLIKQQYLDALYEFNLLQVEMDYWMGR